MEEINHLDNFRRKKFKIFLRADHHDQYNANYKMLHFVFMSVAVRRSICSSLLSLKGRKMFCFVGMEEGRSFTVNNKQ